MQKLPNAVAKISHRSTLGRPLPSELSVSLLDEITGGDNPTDPNSIYPPPPPDVPGPIG